MRRREFMKAVGLVVVGVPVMPKRGMEIAVDIGRAKSKTIRTMQAPDGTMIRLTPLQQEIFDAYVRGENIQFTHWPHGSGKTFLYDLIREYERRITR